MTKKITILLLGLVLGANIHSGEQEQQEQVKSKITLAKIKYIGGTIAKYVLYGGSACATVGSLGAFSVGMVMLIEAYERMKLLAYISDDEGYVLLRRIMENHSIPGKQIVFSSVMVALTAGLAYKAASMIGEALEKNKEVEEKAQNA